MKRIFGKVEGVLVEVLRNQGQINASNIIFLAAKRLIEVHECIFPVLFSLSILLLIKIEFIGDGQLLSIGACWRDISGWRVCSLISRLATEEKLAQVSLTLNLGTIFFFFRINWFQFCFYRWEISWPTLRNPLSIKNTADLITLRELKVKESICILESYLRFVDNKKKRCENFWKNCAILSCFSSPLEISECRICLWALWYLLYAALFFFFLNYKSQAQKTEIDWARLSFDGLTLLVSHLHL